MLLGSIGFLFTTSEARGQAGGGAGGGPRAVTITAVSNTPGITLTGPIEDGFDEGVTAFLVEFTPPNPGDEPPAQAAVAISITPEDGWTLQQPNQANLPVMRDTPRGAFADDIEWQAARLAEGGAEDLAQGNIRVVWPWAEFEVSEFEARRFASKVGYHAGGFFRKATGIEMETFVTIQVTPENLPEAMRDNEAQHWSTGWVQNVRSLGRTCIHPRKIQIWWWDTEKKANMPIFDNILDGAEIPGPLWYSSDEVATFRGDDSDAFIYLEDYPYTDWAVNRAPDPDDAFPLPNPEDPHSSSRATRALQLDQFTAWIVTTRGQGERNIVRWLKWVNWSTDFRVDLEAPQSGPYHPWDGITYIPEIDKVNNGLLHDGKGGLEPDTAYPHLNAITHRETRDR
jgi:hypothetical protein